MFGPLFPIEWVVGNFLVAKFDFGTFACFFLIGMIGVVILLEVCSMVDIGMVDGIDSTWSASCELGRVWMTGDIIGESEVVDLSNDEQRFASNKIGEDSMTGDVNDES